MDIEQTLQAITASLAETQRANAETQRANAEAQRANAEAQRASEQPYRVFDEKVEVMRERQQALTESLQPMASMHKDLEKHTAQEFDKVAKLFAETDRFINSLTHIAAHREERLDNLEGN